MMSTGMDMLPLYISIPSVDARSHVNAEFTVFAPWLRQLALVPLVTQCRTPTTIGFHRAQREKKQYLQDRVSHNGTITT